jgi:hypothetical protein
LKSAEDYAAQRKAEAEQRDFERIWGEEKARRAAGACFDYTSAQGVYSHSECTRLLSPSSRVVGRSLAVFSRVVLSLFSQRYFDLPSPPPSSGFPPAVQACTLDREPLHFPLFLSQGFPSPLSRSVRIFVLSEPRYHLKFTSSLFIISSTLPPHPFCLLRFTPCHRQVSSTTLQSPVPPFPPHLSTALRPFRSHYNHRPTPSSPSRQCQFSGPFPLLPKPPPAPSPASCRPCCLCRRESSRTSSDTSTRFRPRPRLGARESSRNRFRLASGAVGSRF